MNIRGAFRVLCLASDVSWNKQLAFDAETFEIAAQLAAAETGADVLWDPVFAPRRNALFRYLWEYRPQAVHFLTHGSARDGIVLADDQGHARRLDDDALDRVFAELGENHVRLLVLSPCFTQGHIASARKHVDCVVVIHCPLGITGQLTFCGSFYRALSFGQSVQEAFDETAGALRERGLDVADMVQLHSRPGINAGAVVPHPAAAAQWQAALLGRL